MSLQSELSDLTANLAAAKTAVTNKGGTVGDTGLAGLSTEIATIPTPVTYDYGTVTIMSTSPYISTSSLSNCTVTITDQAKLFNYLLENDFITINNITSSPTYRASFSWNVSDYSWSYSSASGMQRLVDEDFATNGMTIVRDTSQSSASVTLSIALNEDPTNPITLNITDRNDYQSLGYLKTEFTFYYGGGYSDAPKSFRCNGGTYLRTTITGYTFGPDCDFVPDAFLMDAVNLTSTITLPAVEEIGDYFMYECVNYASTMVIPQGVKKIGADFMGYCTSFNSPISFPSSVEEIGDYFLYYCSAFNSAISNIPQVERLRYFMYHCDVFNQPITFPSTVKYLNGAFYYCYAFNQSITLPSGVKDVGYFLTGASSFNQPITIPSTVENASNFLRNATSFNSVVSINTGIKTLTYFLFGCSAYNKPLTIPSSVTTIGDYCLNNCTSFNQSISIPTTVTKIGSYFLSSATSFNSTISLGNITQLGQYFLNGCTSFNKNITLPSTITTIAVNNFMYNCNAMVSTVTVNTSASVSANVNVLSTATSSAPCYTTGIKVGGTYGSNWRSTFANRTSSPYRKLLSA